MTACRASAILATLQAGYTDFKFLSPASKEIFEREALIGCSITGWVNNPDVLFNPDNLQRGAKLVMKVNKEVALIIGIRPAARGTCAKPSGNASVLLKTGSGIHAEHAPRYLRNAQMKKLGEVAKLIAKTNPQMVQDSLYSNDKSDYCISFPVVAPEGSLFREDLLGVKQLELVKLAQQNWVEYGTDESLCVDKRLRHNISNTIPVDDWDEVEQYVWENRHIFAGISFMPEAGDKAYAQAPFTEVKTPEECVQEYGVAAVFASGLIVDGLAAFNSLWTACDTASLDPHMGETLDNDDHSTLLKRDWVRRCRKFATNYLEDDLNKAFNCLKDMYNIHIWEKIHKSYNPINFLEDLPKKAYTEVDTMGGVACAGGTCEINF